MNLGEFRTAIGRRTGIATDDTALNEIINEAVQAVAEERDWPWLNAIDSFSTVDGTQAYTLPTGWERTVAVTYSGQPTSRMNIADVDAFDWVTDRPSYRAYAIDSGYLYLLPTPTSVVTVTHRYIKSEPALAVDADSPLMDARFDGAVIYYAAAVIYDRVDDSRADRARLEYQRWLGRMRDAQQRSQQPSRIRVRPGAGW